MISSFSSLSIEFSLELGNGFFGDITDFLVLRDVHSIEAVLHDFYTNRLVYNLPYDTINQSYYADRILFYIHSLRYHEQSQSIIHLYSPTRLEKMDKVTFYQGQPTLILLLSNHHFDHLLYLVERFIQHNKESIDISLYSH